MELDDLSVSVVFGSVYHLPDPRRERRFGSLAPGCVDLLTTVAIPKPLSGHVDAAGGQQSFLPVIIG